MATPFARITRDAATKAATLHVTGDGDWQAFAGSGENAVDFARPIASGAGPGGFPLPDSFRVWTCFAVKKGAALCYAAERHLPMAGGYNFRDLGGFPAAGGKRTAWGKFFRTDDMKGLTDADLAYLASIPIVTVVDFRAKPERERAPDRLPGTVKTDLHCPVSPGNLNPGTDLKSEYGTADALMLAIYRDLARDADIAATYREFFARVQDENDVPLLFHCSAGKDRTGFAAALILFALGVNRETILADYEASNRYLGDKYAHLVGPNPEYSGLFTVKRAFLEETLRLIEEAHGSVETYLAEILKVDIQALRRRYLC